MKILLVSPYLPKHFGGGEKYIFDVAKTLAENGHQVMMAIPNLSKIDENPEKIKKNYEDFLSYSLEEISFIDSQLTADYSFLQKLFWTRKFDLIYYQTDGSLFFSLAKKNILHIQVPLILDKSSLIERLKLKNWQIKNTNSEFTKAVIEKTWQTKIDFVHHPAVDLDKFNAKKKEKIILNVGRFFRHLHSKRQDVLIEIFKEMLEKYPKETQGWKLVLVGKVEDQEYFTEIKKASKSLPIEIKENLDNQKLIDLYEKASIYWHATGYDIDLDKQPEKAEHFGISTVEAMAAEAIPVVINKGGQQEILGEQLKLLLWNSKEEAIEKRSQQFSKEKFKEVLLTMINQ
jgi:glycosyltransferase involved in cell wall biosynthesis